MQKAISLMSALLIGLLISSCANLPGEPCEADGYNYCLAREGWND